jgi:hypothetical protein
MVIRKSRMGGLWQKGKKKEVENEKADMGIKQKRSEWKRKAEWEERKREGGNEEKGMEWYRKVKEKGLEGKGWMVERQG